MIDSVQITAKDGKTYTAYPLTQAQRLMYFVYNTYSRELAMLNIGTGCYWQGDFDEALLREAIGEARDRCDTMRLRFKPDLKFGLVQFLSEEPLPPVETVDLSDRTTAEADGLLEAETRVGTPLEDNALSFVKIVRMPEGRNGFYCKLHHLAFDGYAAKLFMADVMAIYLSKRGCGPYPKPMKPYLEAMTQELEYLNSDRRKADRAYWMQRFSTESEPIFNDYLLDNRLEKARRESGDDSQRYVLMFEGEHPVSKQLYYEVSAQDTEKVLAMCEQRGLSVPCVLMLGLRTALSSFNREQPDVSFKFMINRRGTLLEKKSGGNRWHFYTLRTIVDPSLTFAEAARLVEDEQNEVFRHCAFDTLEMYHIKHMAMHMDRLEQTYDSMSFSYHAPLEILFESEEVKKTARGVWYHNGYSAQNLYLTVKHRLDDNGLEFIFEYRVSEEAAAHDLAVFYDRLIRTVMLGAEDPDRAIGEILARIEPQEA